MSCQITCDCCEESKHEDEFDTTVCRECLDRIGNLLRDPRKSYRLPEYEVRWWRFETFREVRQRSRLIPRLICDWSGAQSLTPEMAKERAWQVAKQHGWTPARWWQWYRRGDWEGPLPRPGESVMDKVRACRVFP